MGENKFPFSYYSMPTTESTLKKKFYLKLTNSLF